MFTIVYIPTAPLSPYLCSDGATQIPVPLYLPLSPLPFLGLTSPPSSPPIPLLGALLLGDAFNMRHPLTGGGMTVALSDCKLLCDMLQPLPSFSDAVATASRTADFYVRRKPMSATINTLANALYKVFSYTGKQCRGMYAYDSKEWCSPWVSARPGPAWPCPASLADRPRTQTLPGPALPPQPWPTLPTFKPCRRQGPRGDAPGVLRLPVAGRRVLGRPDLAAVGPQPQAVGAGDALFHGAHTGSGSRGWGWGPALAHVGGASATLAAGHALLWCALHSTKAVGSGFWG